MMVLGQEIYIYLLTGILALGATAVAVVPFLISSRRSRVRSPGKPTEAAVEPEAARPSILRRIGDGIEWLLARLWELRSVLRRPVDAAAAATAEAEAERPPFWRRKRDSLRRIRALRLRMPVELAGAAEAPVGHIAAPPSVSPEPPVLNSLPEPPPAMADVSSATASETVAAVPDLLPVVEPPPVTADAPPVTADAPPVMADVPSATASEPVAAVPDLPVAEPPPVMADAPSAAADVPPVMAEPPPVMADAPSAAADVPPVMADPPPVMADAPPSVPARETVVAEGVVSEPMAADVPPVEEQLPPQPPSEPDLPPAKRLSVEELAKWEQNVDKMLDEEPENAEEKEERYLEEAVSEDVKEVFGTGVGDEDEDEDEEKDELDSMFDLFKTEVVVETDASRLAALLGEVDARDLLSEAQEILNELRSSARRGGR